MYRILFNIFKICFIAGAPKCPFSFWWPIREFAPSYKASVTEATEQCCVPDSRVDKNLKFLNSSSRERFRFQGWQKQKKTRKSRLFCFWWPIRESNPSFQRERLASWPLDQWAILTTALLLYHTFFEIATPFLNFFYFFCFFLSFFLNFLTKFKKYANIITERAHRWRLLLWLVKR